MSYDATALSEAQREYIGDTIELLHQQAADFLKRLERSAPKEKTNFRGRREPLEVAPNPSFSLGNPDGGDMATPDAPRFNHLLIPYVWSNLGLETTYNALMNAGKETVGNAFYQIAESTSKQMIKWLNIFASNGDGTAKIGLVSTRTSNSVLTLNDTTDSIGATQILVGQRVTVWDPTGTTQRVGVVGSGVIKIGSNTKTTLTRDATGIDWPSDVVAGDIIVPQGVTPSVAMKGIPYIVNNVGDYFGLSRSAVDSVQSTIVNGSGGLTAALLQAAYSRIRQRTGMDEMGQLELAMGMTQHDAYAALLTPISFQHIGQTQPQGDIGVSSQEFTWFGTPLKQYFDWRGDRIDFLNFKYLKIADLKSPGSILAGMPISDELQSFNGTTSSYKAAKAKFFDAARDNFSNQAHRLGAITSLPMTNLSQQKS